MPSDGVIPKRCGSWPRWRSTPSVGWTPRPTRPSATSPTACCARSSCPSSWADACRRAGRRRSGRDRRARRASRSSPSGSKRSSGCSRSRSEVSSPSSAGATRRRSGSSCSGWTSLSSSVRPPARSRRCARRSGHSPGPWRRRWPAADADAIAGDSTSVGRCADRCRRAESRSTPRSSDPRSSRPDLFLLCDVSGSVAEFASFTLTLLQAMSAEFSRMRSFAFVDGIDEVTDHLKDVASFLEVRHVLYRADVVARTDTRTTARSSSGSGVATDRHRLADRR